MSEDQQRPELSAPQYGTFRVPRSVYYAVYEPEGEFAEPPGLLFAFHGYGQSANSFIRPLEEARRRNFIVVAPQAPNQFYWQQGTNAVGFTWMTRYQRENALEDNRVFLSELAERVSTDYSYDPERVFALGFSQGCAMAFRFAESGAVKLRGLVACCGDLPKDVEDELHVLDPFPVYIVHGKDDSVVAKQRSEEAEAALSRHDFPADVNYFDGGHELPAEQVAQILDWIEVQSREEAKR